MNVHKRQEKLNSNCPKKQAKFGFKNYVLAESRTGIVLRLEFLNRDRKLLIQLKDVKKIPKHVSYSSYEQLTTLSHPQKLLTLKIHTIRPVRGNRGTTPELNLNYQTIKTMKFLLKTMTIIHYSVS